MSGFKMQRLGLVMEPDPGNTEEIEGVLNPAAVRGPNSRSPGHRRDEDEN